MFTLFSFSNFNMFNYVLNNEYTNTALRHFFILFYLFINTTIHSMYKSICTIITNFFEKGIITTGLQTFYKIAELTQENINEYLNTILQIFIAPLYNISLSQFLADIKGQIGITQAFLWTSLQGLMKALNPFSYFKGNNPDTSISLSEDIENFESMQKFNDAVMSGTSSDISVQGGISVYDIYSDACIF